MRTTRYELFQVLGFPKETPDGAAQRLRRFKYTAKKGAGFIIDVVRNDRIEGKFVEYREDQIVVSDPFGHQQSFMRPVFETTKFQISKIAPNLIISDSPRSNRSFFFAFSEAFDDSLSVHSVEIDLLRVFDAAKAGGHNPNIIRATLSDVSLSRSASAKILISGTEDVRTHFKVLAGSRPFEQAPENQASG